jgi:flagellar basal-body rod modification protein FlgD
MTTSAVNATASSNSTAGTTQTNNGLDRNAFLKLLTTQLANQDPMKPMDDTAFIAQLAQFSSLEQMQTMNGTLTALATSQSAFDAAGLIGRTATWIDPATGDTTSGKIDGVVFDQGAATLKSGDADIPLAYVQSLS